MKGRSNHLSINSFDQELKNKKQQFDSWYNKTLSTINKQEEEINTFLLEWEEQFKTQSNHQKLIENLKLKLEEKIQLIKQTNNRFANKIAQFSLIDEIQRNIHSLETNHDGSTKQLTQEQENLSKRIQENNSQLKKINRQQNTIKNLTNLILKDDSIYYLPNWMDISNLAKAMEWTDEEKEMWEKNKKTEEIRQTWSMAWLTHILAYYFSGQPSYKQQLKEIVNTKLQTIYNKIDHLKNEVAILQNENNNCQQLKDASIRKIKAKINQLHQLKNTITNNINQLKEKYENNLNKINKFYQHAQLENLIKALQKENSSISSKLVNVELYDQTTAYTLTKVKKIYEHEEEISEPLPAIDQQAVFYNYKANLVNIQNTQDILKSFKEIELYFTANEESLLIYAITLDAMIDLNANEEINQIEKSFRLFVQTYNCTVLISFDIQQILVSILIRLSMIKPLETQTLITCAEYFQTFYKENINVMLDDFISFIKVNIPLIPFIEKMEFQNTNVEASSIRKLINLLKIQENIDIKIEHFIKYYKKQIGPANQQIIDDYIATILVKDSIKDIVECFAKTFNYIFDTFFSIDCLFILKRTFKTIEELFKQEKHKLKIDNISLLLAKFYYTLVVNFENSDQKTDQHGYIISIIRSLNNMHMYLEPYLKEKIADCLCFKEITSTSNSAYISVGLTVCARVGIDIKKTIDDLNTQGFFEKLRARETTSVLFSCFIHDANTKRADEKISSAIVKSLLDKANSHFCINKNELDISKNIQEMLYDSSSKAAKFPRYLLQAAAYYNYEINAELHLLNKINLSDDITVSPLQDLLFEFLQNAFSSYPHLTLKKEKKIIAGFGVDIFLDNAITNKKYDIEYDGLKFHYYRNPNFTFQDIKLREDKARDKVLKNNGLKVIRFTVKDFGINKPISKKLKNFINKMINCKVEENEIPSQLISHYQNHNPNVWFLAAQEAPKTFNETYVTRYKPFYR